MRFSKIVISIILLANILFTATVLYIFLKVEAEPVALIGAWFAFTTGEVISLATIKIKEGKNDK